MFRIPCKAIKKAFPPGKEDELGFMICIYEATSEEVLPDYADGLRFSAKGALLPYCTRSDIVLIGDKWEKTSSGITLNCVGYEEEIYADVEAATEFLRTLGGCEVSEANRICNTIEAEDIISALQEDPDIFDSCIKNQGTAQRIKEEFLLRRSHKEQFFFLLPYLPKSASAATAAIAALSAGSVDKIKEDPFSFAINGLLPYGTCRKIAKDYNIDVQSFRGVQAALVDVLLQNEGSSSGFAYDSEAVGNTYATVKELASKAANIVGLPYNADIISQALNALIQEGYFTCVDETFIYRAQTAAAEYGIAAEIARLCSAAVEKRNYQQDIFALEDNKGMRLALEQCNAVKTALNNPVTLLVGGPGTGKTSIEQFIIEIYRKYYSEPILLVAPTGKAARRMSESTGEPACTVHKALGVSAGSEVIVSDTVLDAGLILCDEASMLDSQVSHALLKAVKTGTRLVIVGDTNQLPSVGSGNVLYELLKSKAIATSALELVHRQAAGSTIAINCARIKRGVTSLEYSDAFIFVEAASQEDAAAKVIAAYKDEMARGLTPDDICLLSPFRKKTLTGVDSLNTEIQKFLTVPSTPSLSYGKKVFYLGDKVMLMANHNDVANGDIGHIVNIDLVTKHFDVDYGDGKVVSYPKSSLREFELAFGITIHKSQGSEYKTCIITLMDEHKSMLKRNLVYTAVSRAKQKVIIVGTKTALEQAICAEDVTKRKSRLGEIVSSSSPKA